MRPLIDFHREISIRKKKKHQNQPQPLRTHREVSEDQSPPWTHTQQPPLAPGPCWGQPLGFGSFRSGCGSRTRFCTTTAAGSADTELGSDSSTPERIPNHPSSIAGWLCPKPGSHRHPDTRLGPQRLLLSAQLCPGPALGGDPAAALRWAAGGAVPALTPQHGENAACEVSWPFKSSARGMLAL